MQMVHLGYNKFIQINVKDLQINLALACEGKFEFFLVSSP